MRVLLDSVALLSIVEGGSRGERVKQLVLESDAQFTTVLNVYEMRYRLLATVGRARMQEAVDGVTSALKVLPVTLDLSEPAAEIKAANAPLGAVDCVTYAAALKNDCTLVTGDRDFTGLKGVLLF